MLASVMIPRIKENLLNGRLFGVIFMSGGFVVVVFQSGFLFPFFACVCVCVCFCFCFPLWFMRLLFSQCLSLLCFMFCFVVDCFCCFWFLVFLGVVVS